MVGAVQAEGSAAPLIRVVLLLGGFNPADGPGTGDEVAHVESWDWYTMINGLTDGPIPADPPITYDVEVESVVWINRERPPSLERDAHERALERARSDNHPVTGPSPHPRPGPAPGLYDDWHP